MLALLGALIMAALIGGLTMLSIVPLVFVGLLIAVFREPGDTRLGSAATDAGTLPVSPPEPALDATTERSRTMTAGRRLP